MFRVLAFTVKPRESADTRFRVLQFSSAARQDGITIDHRSLIGKRYFQWQIGNRFILLRILLFPGLLAIRFLQALLLAPRYDCIWIAREMAPIGPPLLEQLLLRRCKRVIFDIDDALHISDGKMASLIPRLLRDRSKFSRMAHRYDTVVCGSHELAAFYSRYSSNVRVIPTVVDTARFAATRQIPSTKVRIGWIGTPLNSDHLELVYPALLDLARERQFELVVVGLNKPLKWNLPSIRYLEWKLEREQDYFLQFDIGIMPLRDSPFARGKCAFKLVQYMAGGIPVIASPVGANCDIVEQGRNGYLADTPQQWSLSLKNLIDDPEMRAQMGEYGRRCVHRGWSVPAAWQSYAEILTGARHKETICAD